MSRLPHTRPASPTKLSRMRWLPTALLGLLMLPLAALAGAWTPKAGSSYHKFAINSFSSESFFDTPAPGFRRFTDRNFTYYLEYGISDRLAFYGALPLKRLANDSGQVARSSGVGDIDVGLRYNFLSGPTVVSGSLLFKAPYAYSRGDAVPLGNGQEDVEARILLGRSLGSAGYFGLEAGLRKRFGAPADEFRYLLEYGFDAAPTLYLRAKLDGIAGLGNSSPQVTLAGNPTLNLEFDLAKLEATAGYRLDKSRAVEFTVTRDLYGSNTLRGTTYSLALVFAY